MLSSQDPFRQSRIESGVHYMHAEGKEMPLILRLDDLREACRDWKTFSNDDPFMIVPHSEAHVRSVRQLPIETDPPVHREYRALVEPLFKKPNSEAFRVKMRELTDEILNKCLAADTFDAVRELALPLQSRGLALLLGVDQREADLWISWGIHVFREGDGVSKGRQLNEYVRRMFEQSTDPDGEDFFSLLNRAAYQGRKLTMEEKEGFASVTFAGGRDTVIHTVSGVIAHCAAESGALPFLREDLRRITPAIEEFVRFFSPVTVLARRCPHGGRIAGIEIKPGERVGLCWPSANRDERFFPDPDRLILDRSPNPHVGFGFGVHHCLGAPQARLILRCLITALCERIERIELLEAVPMVERESSYERTVGFERLVVRMLPRPTA